MLSIRVITFLSVALWVWSSFSFTTHHHPAHQQVHKTVSASDNSGEQHACSLCNTAPAFHDIVLPMLATLPQLLPDNFVIIIRVDLSGVFLLNPCGRSPPLF